MGWRIPVLKEVACAGDPDIMAEDWVEQGSIIGFTADPGGTFHLLAFQQEKNSESQSRLKTRFSSEGKGRHQGIPDRHY